MNRTLSFSLAAALSAVGALGCSTDVEVEPCDSGDADCAGQGSTSSGNPGSGGGTSSASVTTGSSSPSGTGGGTSSSASTTPSTGSVGTTSTGGAGTGCGGVVGDNCLPIEFCDYAENLCGNGEFGGTCKLRPTACEDVYSPTCGCDGVTYENPCAANAAGVDASEFAKCPPPEGTFACGSTFCFTFSHYCRITQSDIGGEPNTYSCEEKPNCGQVQPETCKCYANDPCGASCVESGPGQFSVTCAGG